MSISNSERFTPDGHRLILEVRTGSHCHGTNMPESDEDIRGVAIPGLAWFFGLKSYQQDEDREKDVVVYNFKKFMRLAMKGNLSVLNFLFTAKKDRLYVTEWGQRLIDIREEFLSMKVIDCIFGYTSSQLHRMNRGSGRSGNRSSLIEKYGYDTKFAYHAVMLTNIGIQLLKSGTYCTLRPDDEQKLLKKIRVAGVSYEEAMNMVKHNLEVMHALEGYARLPKEPDLERVSKKMVDILESFFYGKITLTDIREEARQ